MNNHDDAGFILCGQLYSGTMSFASALLNYADKNMRNFFSEESYAQLPMAPEPGWFSRKFELVKLNFPWRRHETVVKGSATSPTIDIGGTDAGCATSPVKDLGGLCANAFGTEATEELVESGDSNKKKKWWRMQSIGKQKMISTNLLPA
jgi:hypothetical protein